MFSRNRRLVSGLLSAILAGSGGFASASVAGKVAKGAIKIPLKVAKGAIKIPLKVAKGAIKIPVRMVGDVVALPVSVAYNITRIAAIVAFWSAELVLTLYGGYVIYGFVTSIGDGEIGIYCKSDKEMEQIFDEVTSPEKGAVSKTVNLAVNLGNKGLEMAGINRARGNISLNEVIFEYLKESNDNDVASAVVIKAIEKRVESDIEKGVIGSKYGKYVKLWWKVVVGMLSESKWEKIVNGVKANVKPVNPIENSSEAPNVQGDGQSWAYAYDYVPEGYDPNK